MRWIASLVLSILVLSGCATSPTPVPPTATSVPPTATQVPTTTPVSPTATRMLSASSAMSSMSMASQSVNTTLGKVAVGTSYFTNVSPDELKTMLAKKDFALINVHTPYIGEIADTDIFVPYNELDKSMDKFPKDKGAKMVIYCRSGMMSTPTSEMLVKMGYANVFNLVGGMNAWTAKQFPLLNNPK